jgi:hypothetical protein
VARRKWVENITAQQEAMRERSMVFDTFMLSEDVFVGEAKVNCAVPYGECSWCHHDYTSLTFYFGIRHGSADCIWDGRRCVFPGVG